MKKRKKRPGQTQGHRPSPAWSQALALTPNQRASPRKTQWDAWISCHHRNSSTDGGWGHHHHHHQLRKWWRITHWKKKSTLLFVGDLCLWCFVCFLHIIICWKTKKHHDICGIYHVPIPGKKDDLPLHLLPSIGRIRHLRLGFQDRAASIQDVGFLQLNPHRTAGFSKVFCCGGREGTNKKIPTNQPTNHEMMIEKNCTPIISTGFFLL